jgi:CheY-like chemotaxis protein
MEKPIVLLVEDEDNDVFLVRRYLRKMSEPVLLQRAKDGVEAIEYLEGRHKFSDRRLFPLPSLILLDIKMPRKDGFDVLEWFRGQPALHHIPIVMVTSSHIDSDMKKCLELGAKAYLVKPIPIDDLKRLFTTTQEFLSTRAH